MLIYSLNRIMVPGIILLENIVNAGHKSICVKVMSIGRPQRKRERERGFGQDNHCDLLIKALKNINEMYNLYFFCEQGCQQIPSHYRATVNYYTIH